MAIDLVFEFFKTVIVAAFIAFVLDRYLRGVLGEGTAGRVSRAGLGDAYPSRKEAAPVIRRSLNDTLVVNIMGISLRDYLEPVYDLEARYGEGANKAIIGQSPVR
jgi:hypothetical protein